MGMRDESWCSSCGTSLPYSENEVQCGECVGELMSNNTIKYVEYMKLHLISLLQDSQILNDKMEETDMNSKDYDYLEIEDISLNGQIIATRHLLSVVPDILGIQTEEK